MPMSGAVISLFFQAMGRNMNHPTYFKCLPSPKVNVPYKCLRWLQRWVETPLSPVWIMLFKRKDATVTRFIHHTETTHNWCQPCWFNGANPPQPFPEAKVRPYATAVSNCRYLLPRRSRFNQQLNWTKGRWRNPGRNWWRTTRVRWCGFFFHVVLLFPTNSWHSKHKPDSAPNRSRSRFAANPAEFWGIPARITEKRSSPAPFALHRECETRVWEVTEPCACRWLFTASW